MGLLFSWSLIGRLLFVGDKSCSFLGLGVLGVPIAPIATGVATNGLSASVGVRCSGLGAAVLLDSVLVQDSQCAGRSSRILIPAKNVFILK